MTELSGRTVNYGYDNIYRLTSEAVLGDPAGNNGTINYAYDPVGNRTQQTSTNPAITSGTFGFDADDRLTTDSYDANGNTIASGGLTYTYDFENHLIQQGGATFVYDGDGNRVEKIVAGITTKYLISEVNPTGYPQVVGEYFSGNTTPPYDTRRVYVYGLDRISQYRNYFTGTQSLTQTSYYVYDGHGSVRALTDPNGNITDTYDYDAFGNLTHTSTTLSSPTPNEFLFAGEQYDSNLNLYYNRARYLNTTTGRFWTMDTYEGDPQSPLSLHRYLYVAADPVNGLDPSGHQDDIDEVAEEAADQTLNSMSTLSIRSVLTNVYLTLGRAIPLLVEKGAFYLAAAGAALKLISAAPTALDYLAQNIQDYTGTFSRGNFPRGMEVGRAAAQNLGDNFPVFDNFDSETGEGTQIFSTTQSQTTAQLVSAIRAKAEAFQRGFESREVFAGKNALGDYEQFYQSDVKTRNMLVVTSPTGNFSLSQIADELEKIETETGLDQIEVVESQGLAP